MTFAHLHKAAFSEQKKDEESKEQGHLLILNTTDAHLPLDQPRFS